MELHLILIFMIVAAVVAVEQKDLISSVIALSAADHGPLDSSEWPRDDSHLGAHGNGGLGLDRESRAEHRVNLLEVALQGWLIVDFQHLTTPSEMAQFVNEVRQEEPGQRISQRAGRSEGGEYQGAMMAQPRTQPVPTPDAVTRLAMSTQGAPAEDLGQIIANALQRPAASAEPPKFTLKGGLPPVERSDFAQKLQGAQEAAGRELPENASPEQRRGASTGPLRTGNPPRVDETERVAEASKSRPGPSRLPRKRSR